MPHRLVGYFPEWAVYARNYHVTNINAQYLTDINYAFAKPTLLSSNSAALSLVDSYAAIEKLYPGDTGDEPFQGSLNQLVLFKQQYPHINTFISVGGASGSDDFSDIMAYTNARSSFVASCVAFMTNYHFDGIDFDWEFPVSGGAGGVGHRPEDAANYAIFIQLMRAALDSQSLADGNDYLMTMAVPAVYAALTNRYELLTITASVDWLNLMAYDLAGYWDAQSGHMAPLYSNPSAYLPEYNIDTAIQCALMLGIPARKLVLGIPFYGRGFAGVGSTDNGLFQPSSGASTNGSWEAGCFDYRDLREGTCGHQYIGNHGYSRYWDPISKAPWLYNPDTDIFISYDDTTSVYYKTGYVQTHNLGGVMYWSLDADTANAELQQFVYSIMYPEELSFRAFALCSNVVLRWQSPVACGYLNDTVMVRRSDASYPTSPTNHQLVYSGTNTMATDEGLTPGTTYYYTIWLSDGSDWLTPP